MRLLTNAPAGSPEWLAARAGKITASTAASILAPGMPGVYGSPLTEYERIMRELEHGAIDALPDGDDDDDHDRQLDDDEEEERTAKPARDELEWGLASEQLHADLLTKHSGLRFEPAGVYQDETLPWLVASPDRFAIDPARADHGVAELKSPVRMVRDSEEARYGWLIQNTIQMRVTRMTWGVLSLLIPPRPRWQRTVLAPDMEEWTISGLTAFWDNHIMRGVAPGVSGSDADLDALKALYPQSTARRIVFSMAAIDAAQSLETAKAAKKEIEAQEKAAKAVLLAELGDAEAGILPDGTGYTYKSQRSERPAKEATTLEFRVLRKAKKL